MVKSQNSPAFHLAVVYCFILFNTLALEARSVPNFNLLDSLDKDHELYRADGKAVVLFFTSTGCPIARQAIQKIKILQEEFKSHGVQFWIINSEAEATRSAVRREINWQRLKGTTYLRDRKQIVALAYRVHQTATVVAIDTETFEEFYRGTVEESSSEAVNGSVSVGNFLKNALNQFLNGEPISIPQTPEAGSLISFAPISLESGQPDYATQIAPLLKQRCVDCHRSGGIGPWSMTDHRRISNYSDMIEEVLLTRRMPPWDPHPDYGTFLNDNTLSREESQLLIKWIQAGSPNSIGDDPMEEPLPPVPEWELGDPDAVLRLPAVQKIAATGIEPYRRLKVENPFDSEVWIQAIDINPGNPAVVHHVILFAKYESAPSDSGEWGTYMYGWAPGATPLKYPAGVAKRLPPEAKLTIEMHYTTTGEEQTDRTEIALYLAPGPRQRIGETLAAIQTDLDIPAFMDEARHTATYHFPFPATIYGLFPHMHYRGKWMRYELLLPNGKRETLLHVPRYDFQWQMTYYLEEPRGVPAGTWMIVTGAFDNSASNPSNPDPSAPVFWGDQSWEEMFVGYFESADDPTP